MNLSSGQQSNILWIEPFAYKPGEPFRVMPIGSFKRGERTLDITAQRLQDMAANYAAQRPRWKIPIYAGHPTDQQPDPPKLGNIAKLEVKADGLYAVPEYSDDGAKMAQDGYQYVSPGVLWSLNGSRYVDEQGKEFDNVIDHVALTNRPFFGAHTALFSADPEVMTMVEMNGEDPTGYSSHRLLNAMQDVTALSEDMKDVPEVGDNINTAKDALKKALAAIVAMFSDPNKRAEDFAAMDMKAVHKHLQAAIDLHQGHLDGTEPTSKSSQKKLMDHIKAAMAAMGPMENMSFDSFAVWTTAFMNDLPDSSFLHIESGGEKDSDGKTTPRSLRHFPYKDASGKVDLPHLRNALARIPQSSLPADVKARVISKAQKLAASAGIGTSEKTSDTSQEREDMSDTSTPTASPPEGLVIKPDEFAAIKAQAAKAETLEAQVTILKGQADQFAAALQETKRARRSDQLVARYEAFTAVPEKAETLAAKMLAIEEQDAELFKYFDGLLATLDKALTQSELFGQIGSARADAQPAETLEALTEQIVKEKFSGDMGKYADALDQAQKQRPDLAREYLVRPSVSRG